MIPIVELRGAIPIALSLGVPIQLSYIVSILGNLLPFPFIFKFAPMILSYGQNKPIIVKIFNWILDRGRKCGEKMKKKNNIYIALAFFIGIPFVGTGLWTGVLASTILDLNIKKSFIATFCGVILSGVIMIIVSTMAISLV